MTDFAGNDVDRGAGGAWRSAVWQRGAPPVNAAAVDSVGTVGDVDVAGQGVSASAAGTPRRLREKTSLGAGSPASASAAATPRRLCRKTSVDGRSPGGGPGEISGATACRAGVGGSPEVAELGAFTKSRTYGSAGEAHAEIRSASPVMEKADTPEARGSTSFLPRKRERGEAPASSTSALEVADAAGAQAETEVAPPRRSGRVAARTDEQRVRSRIVTGFGHERVDDLAADEARRIAEGARRGDARRNEGTRGRMTDFTGDDLDRGAGGAFRLGRR